MVLYLNDTPNAIEYNDKIKRFRHIHKSLIDLIDQEDDECDCHISKHASSTTIASSDQLPTTKIDTIKKTVRFNFSSEIFPVTNRAEISRTERKATWYRKKEYKTIQSDNDSIKNSYNINECSELSENGTHSIRGLERLIDTQYAERRQRIMRAYFTSVLGEQTRQRMLGYASEERISNASMLLSRWSRDCALAMGRVDEFYVRSDDGYYDVSRLGMFDGSGKGLMKYILSLNVVDEVLDVGDNASNSCFCRSQNENVSLCWRDSKDNQHLTLGEIIQCGAEMRMNHCSIARVVAT